MSGKDRKICLYHIDVKIVFTEYITMKIAVMKMVVPHQMMNVKNYFRKMIGNEHPSNHKQTPKSTDIASGRICYMTQGIKEKDIQDFEKYARKLSDVMKRIREYKPEANAYLACESLHLMSCDFHDIDRIHQQDYSVVDITMENFDGGDW